MQTPKGIGVHYAQGQYAVQLQKMAGPRFDAPHDNAHGLELERKQPVGLRFQAAGSADVGAASSALPRSHSGRTIAYGDTSALRPGRSPTGLLDPAPVDSEEHLQKKPAAHEGEAG
jgi:hypothetical protein